MDYWNSPGWIFASIIGVVIIIVIIALSIESKQARKRKDRRLEEASRFANQLASTGQLPTVSTPLLLEQGEVAFFSESTPLLETRAVRSSRSGHVGVRVAKGVYAGSSQGTSSSTQEWTVIDEGQLVITNRRVIFSGGATNRTFKFAKIVSIDYDLHQPDSIALLSVEGRQKNMAFQVSNPAIFSAIVQLCKQVDDPLQLSGRDFQFHVIDEGGA